MSRIALALVWLLHFLPLRAIAALGDALGGLAFWLIPERRRVTRINLEKCFPGMEPAQRERIARAHFRAACRTILDLGVLWWAPRERVERMVRIEGLEHLRALGATPSILLAPHFVGVDIGGARLGAEVDMVSMYAAQKDRMLSEMLLHGRRRFGTHKLVSRQQGIRAVIAGMRQGLPFYYLPDQDYGAQHSVFVPFFGTPAATIPMVARLAKIAGARVVMAVSEMTDDGYVLHLEPPWSDFPTGDVEADTARMNREIERWVERMPDQYLWTHRRFKSRPPGAPPVY